jgi:putative transposase
MSTPERRAMIDPDNDNLSVRRQCELLQLARSGVYRPKPEVAASDLAVMRRIDELHVEMPFYGSRRMTFELNQAGAAINRKRVQRLMRVMDIVALVPRPGTSKPGPGHKIYPYLLRGVSITEPNHVWASDITYIPMAHGFLYLVAIIDWASRAVLAWRLSNTMAPAFASLRSMRRWRGTASRGSSTPTKAASSPAKPSPAGSQRQVWRFRWTAVAASWTTSSSNACGARSNMKRCI